MGPGARLHWGAVRGASDQCEKLGRPPVIVAPAAVRQLLKREGRPVGGPAQVW
jgi:hypothetical protein